MRKIVITLERKEGTTFEEFREYYFEEHAPIAEEIPNLERYTVSLPVDPDEAPYDAVAELAFADAGAMQEGMRSEAAQRALEDVPNFADPNGGFDMAVEEHVQVG